jgi:hypothetical protein
MREQVMLNKLTSKIDLQLLEDALYLAQAIDANGDRAQRMRETGEFIHNLITEFKQAEASAGKSREKPLPGLPPAGEKLSGERWLANRGFADSRNYSASDLGTLLDEFAKGTYSAGVDDAIDKIIQQLQRYKRQHRMLEFDEADVRCVISELKRAT